ncbi:MAG: signal peptidase I [Candidatus Jorgensenbacteria bacterium]|nr:signal peptidase I [Candidatus Jorgensenbacteria bacterium]
MRKFAWSLFEVFQTVAIAVVAVFFVRTFIAQPFLVSGASMEPTFSNGDYLLVDELVFRFREPVRGEVLVFRYPGDDRSFYIKRVIGLPGERVVMRNGIVTVTRPARPDASGHSGGSSVPIVLPEPYVAQLVVAGDTDVTLGDGEYYVLGDNRGSSFDSRSWGSLPEDHIVGLVRMRLWPLSSALAFSAPSY